MNMKSGNIILKEHDLLLESTMFGYAISGKIPSKLVSSSYDVQAGIVIPVLTHNVSVSHLADVFDDTSVDDSFNGFQAIISNESENLDNLVRMSWEKELSLGVMKNETHTDDEKAIQIFLH